ncbi:MAG: glycosyltransferase [Gemmatimonadaceae bacterium]
MRPGVVVFLPSLEGGGAERAMVEVANALAASHANVTLAVASSAGPYRDEISPDVRLVDLAARGTVAALLPLVRLLRRERPVALLTAMRHANIVATLATALARRDGEARTRVVISERSTISAMRRIERTLMSRILDRLARWTYPHSHAVVAVSEGVAEDLRGELGGSAPPIHVIYNPTVTPGLARLAAEPIPHPWLDAGEPPVVVAVGRLIAAKGYDVLLRAFAQVRRARSCRLVILGEGPDRAALEQLARDLRIDTGVLLPGFAVNPFAWLSRAGLYVLSSRVEGLPNAVVQAMACGAPVVSTDCPSGPREILEGGRWGTLVPVDDVAALADAIQAGLAQRPGRVPDEALVRFTPGEIGCAYARVLGLPVSSARQEQVVHAA